MLFLLFFSLLYSSLVAITVIDQHFFGGAMGVLTTQTLLNSVGVSKNRATSGAVAINWILKVKKMFCHLYLFLVIYAQIYPSLLKQKRNLCHLLLVSFLFVKQQFATIIHSP